MFGLQPPLYGRGVCKHCSVPPSWSGFRSIGILLRADRIAVTILIAAVVVRTAVVAVRAGCRGAGRRPVSCSAIDASADRGACYRPSRNSVSSTGNAVTPTVNRSTPEMGGTSVIASTSVAAATAPTCQSIIRHKGGANQNDCCQCSEGISKHDLFSSHAYGPNNARPAAIRTPGQPSSMSGWRLDLDQRSGHFSNHGDRRDFISVLRASRTGQRALSECREQRNIQAK